MATRPVKILDAAEASRASPTLIGGKAAGLARLESAGANVPSWVVLPVTLFAAHLQRAREHGLDEHLAALKDLALCETSAAPVRAQLEQVVVLLRGAIENTPLTEEAEQAISHALTVLSANEVAVRSSMVGEDSHQQSFAGQCDSVLHVRGVEAARAAVLRCWSSAFTARSLLYRRTMDTPRALPEMAVIVQRMIDGCASGVMFTMNPINGKSDQALISSVNGTGDALVSGAADADEYVVGSDGRELSRALRCGGSLSTGQLAAIHTEGLRLAAVLGEPLDLEWTLDVDALYMLQARPITSVAKTVSAAPHVAPVSAAADRIIWDNSNIQESYCGVTTPLTFSFAARAYASVYEQTMRVLGIPERTIAEHRPLLRNLLGLIRGRVYYNINNWYRGLLLLPSFGRNKADMERMMGLEEPADIVVDQRRSAADRARSLPRMAVTLLRLLGEMRRLPTTVPEFLRRFEEHSARFDRRAVADAPVAELMRQTRWLWSQFVEQWHTPIVNDFHVMMASGRLRRIVEKAVGHRADAIYHALLGGVEGLESAEPTRWLMRLAGVAREDTQLVLLLRRNPPPSVSELQRANAEFASELLRYIDRYGDRTIGELKLETISHREDPAFLLKVIRNYLDQPSLDATRLLENEHASRIAAEREVEERCGFTARLKFRRAVHAARNGIRARESMRLARTRLFGMYRDTYRALGSRLYERDLLSNPRDIFYLTVGEIDAWHSGTAVTTDLRALATLRRQELAGFAVEELPNRLESRDGVLITDVGPQGEHRDARVLQGTACCAGVVEARVRVIMSATDDLDVRGMILTTLRTDPGWAPLFPGAAGILVERGSTLSHSAVLARELGIPAVVGVPGLLKAVQDGDLVRMDGAAGTIEILGRR